MKILIILTSHSQLGSTGKNRFWLEEFTSPYYVFKDAGAELVLASPQGGQPPLDPKVTIRMLKPTQPVVLKKIQMHSNSLPIPFRWRKSIQMISMLYFTRVVMARYGI